MDNWGGGGGGGELGSSLIFYFVAIDDPRKMQAETYTRLGHRVPQRVIKHPKGCIPLRVFHTCVHARKS